MQAAIGCLRVSTRDLGHAQADAVEWMDTRATQTTVGADPAIPPLGAVDGAACT